MVQWLLDHMLWVGLGIVLVLVGVKVVVGLVFRRLIADSEAGQDH